MCVCVCIYKYIHTHYQHAIFPILAQESSQILLGSAAVIQQGIAKTSLVADDFLGSSDRKWLMSVLLLGPALEAKGQNMFFRKKTESTYCDGT